MPTRKWGTEFLVNTTTAGSQDQPTVTALLDGGFMIAWRDDGPADSVIRAQRYFASGSKAGDELLLDSIAGDQTDPALATLANGNIFVVAQDFETASDRDTAAFVYTPAGSFVQDLSPETTNVSDSVRPGVASLGLNGVVTVWQDRTFLGGDIVMRGFKADGTISFGDIVNTNAGTSSSEQFGAAVAVSPNTSKFVVTWHDAGLSGGVRARVFNASDGSQATAEFAVSAAAPGIANAPNSTSVAWLDNGKFVTSWVSFSGDGSSVSIKYAIFNANGSVFAAERLANTTTFDSQNDPAIAALPSGGFVIAWHDFSTTGRDASGTAIRMQAFDGTGDKRGGEILVNTTTGGNQRDVALTTLTDGRVVVTWSDSSATGADGSGLAIRAQIVDPRAGIVDGTSKGDTLYGHDLVDDDIAGLAGTDTIFGLGGHDIVSGGDGSDIIFGGNGNDIIDGGRDVDTIHGEAGDDRINGGSETDAVFGGDGDDEIRGEAGDDRLIGGAGADLLDGGDGEDTADYSTSATGVTAALDASFPGGGDAAGDVFVSVENLIGSNSTTSGDNLRGDAGVNRIDGGAGDDILDGAGGFDTLAGGAGNDTYILVVDAKASIFDTSGNDTIVSSTSIGLSVYNNQFVGNIENVTLVGTDNISATGVGSDNVLIGNDGRNTLTGLGGADILDGGAGADKMVGGLDDDIYVVDDIGDTVIEANEAGIDLVESSVTFALGSQFIERLTLSGEDDIDGIGNAQANTITGNTGDNALDGGGGADTLDGGAGLDILTGGTGDDRYVVDNQGDVVNEFAGEGTADRVSARVSYVLGDEADIEFMTTASSTGIRKINLTGNALDQLIAGNAGMNILKGGGGKDTLQGLGGNDTYYVDSADDTVVETTAGDTADVVVTSVSYTLGTKALIETLRTTSNGGTAQIDLTGNGFEQTIIGNNGTNNLNGGGGKDVLQGLGGNDTYYVDSANDLVVEATGNGTGDLVAANVSYALDAAAEIETLRTTSNAGKSAINLTGNATAQLVLGNSGDNILDGKDGSDTLTGLAGKDFFAFTSALGAGNVDTITDFNIADDTIQIDDAIFAAFAGQLGTILAGNFRSNLSGLAEDTDDRIIYELDTGKLFYDADGNAAGAGIQFATISAQMGLTSADFVVT
jgi:serralysin